MPKVTKPKFDVQKIKRKVAKPVAFLTLFILASYGVRQVLANIDHKASVVITMLTILGLVYIITDNE